MEGVKMMERLEWESEILAVCEGYSVDHVKACLLACGREDEGYTEPAEPSENDRAFLNAVNGIWDRNKIEEPKA